MLTPREFRVALVGCGRISRNHFEALARVDGLRLTAVCDIDPARARAAGEQWRVPSFSSYEQTLREAECDVVALCTPSGLHPQHG
ncbi:MAG TPA: Gfo/Idh/MocA family oxidoreductase, partial [Gemmatimonadaceae bacterium]|nr:Gfo/Idh/MocA family oxidoreductase [Gemmatimonadaceae bacterium]